MVQNVYITRLDFTPSDRHRFYVRASMQNDKNSAAQLFPSQAPTRIATDDSKGISGNYTFTVSSSAVNNLRYGFLRQSLGSRGAGNGSYVTFRGIDLPEANNRSSFTTVPEHNIIDDFTFTKGRHTIQVGGNYRRFTYENTNTLNSYNSATTNAYWLDTQGYAGTGGSFDPSAFGFPDVSSGFTTNYDFAVSALAGIVDEQTGRFNYTISKDGTTGTLLGQGVPVSRSFSLQ